MALERASQLEEELTTANHEVLVVRLRGVLNLYMSFMSYLISFVATLEVFVMFEALYTKQLLV